MNPGDWYLTADELRTQPKILKAVSSLRKAGIKTAVIHYDLCPVTDPKWCPPVVVKHSALYLKSLMTSFDIVFCISNFVKNEFLEFCRKDNQKPPLTIVIPMGHEIPAAHQAAPAESDRPIAAPNLFALCVGTVEPRKNHETVLDAFELLWKKGSELSLVIVGRPAVSGEKISSRINSHPRLGKELIYLSSCDDELLLSLYKRCAFTIMASLYEGYGLPVTESLARGKPCLVSNIPIFREVGERFGVYFDPHSPAALAAEIEKLISERGRLDSLAALIKAEYAPPTWKQCARAVLETLDSFPANGRGRT